MKLTSFLHPSQRGLVLAQVFNLITLLIPVLLGNSEQVATLVFVSAVGSIATHTFTLSFISVYPGIAEQPLKIGFAKTAASMILVFSLIVVGAGVYLWARGDDPLMFFSLAAMIVTQAAYVMATTRLIARGDLNKFSRARMVYASTALILTILAGMLADWTFALVWASSLAFGTAAVVAVFREPYRVIFSPAVSASGPVVLKKFWRSGLSSLIGGIGAQAASLLLPLAGQYSSLWAMTIRITTGFGTIAQFVVAPPLDARFASAARAGDRIEQSRLTRLSALAGVALAGTSALAACIVLFAFSQDSARVDLGIACIATILFCVGGIAPAVSSKFLLTAGAQTGQLMIAIGKLIAVSLVAFFLTSAGLVLALSVIELLAAIAYFAVLVRRIRSRRI